MTINQQLALSYGLFALAIVLLVLFMASSARDRRRAARFAVAFNEKHQLYRVYDREHGRSVGTLADLKSAIETVNALNEAERRGAL